MAKIKEVPKDSEAREYVRRNKTVEVFRVSADPTMMLTQAMWIDGTVHRTESPGSLWWIDVRGVCAMPGDWIVQEDDTYRVFRGADFHYHCSSKPKPRTDPTPIEGQVLESSGEAVRIIIEQNSVTDKHLHNMLRQAFSMGFLARARNEYDFNIFDERAALSRALEEYYG